jgi:peptidoglycan-associated lipoprotein
VRLLVLSLCTISLGGATCHPRTTATTTVSNTPAPEATTPWAPTEAVVAIMLQNFQRVHFEFDSARLTPDSRAALSSNAELMRQYGSLAVEVQGHSDDRGTTEYNLALGQRRAAAVEEYLVALGVSPERVTIVTYGEEIPLQVGGGEVAWAANRRAEFRVIEGSDGAVAGSIE